MDVHFLGELPLDPEVRIGGDTGEPIVQRKGKGEPFLELARNVIARLEVASKDEGPKIEISD
jgi:ATP-binding protein involved in chromosome partitioning